MTFPSAIQLPPRPPLNLQTSHKKISTELENYTFYYSHIKRSQLHQIVQIRCELEPPMLTNFIHTYMNTYKYIHM